jgi:hypothetical protein
MREWWEEMNTNLFHAKQIAGVGLLCKMVLFVTEYETILQTGENR